jgi:hypothetical protein
MLFSLYIIFAIVSAFVLYFAMNEEAKLESRQLNAFEWAFIVGATILWPATLLIILFELISSNY